MTTSVVIIGAVAFERLLELWLARRNTDRLLARGAFEVHAGHYPVIVALHAAWLAGLSLTAWNRPVHWTLLCTFGVVEALRIWVLTALKTRWTTRIIVLPGAPLVDRGPYRFMAHPNYAVVACEIAILPLVFGLFWYAVVFSVLNALLLAIRIRQENNALRQYSGRR